MIEICFGICSSRFRVFRRPIIRKVETVIEITKAAVVLHNYFMRHESKYVPAGYADAQTPFGRRPGEWRRELQGYQGMAPISNQGSNNFTRSAENVRNDFCKYFNSKEGSVAWQWDITTSTFEEESDSE